jgi:hypothetical protein
MQSKTGGCLASQFVIINMKLLLISLANISQTLEKIFFRSSVNLVSFPLITKQITLTSVIVFINFLIFPLISLSSSISPENPGNSIALIFLEYELS